MRMLLYKPGAAPAEVDVEADEAQLAPLLGTRDYEWMTVRMLSLCVIHDPEGKGRGLALNRMLGMTPVYGDFLVCGIEWDDDGTTRAVALTDRQLGLVREVIFNKIPTSDDVTDNLPSYARARMKKQA